MPLHDWTRVPSGLFHDFHQSWSVRIKDALNSGRLPPGTSALVEQRSGRWEGDVLAIEHLGHVPREGNGTSGVVATAPPVTKFVARTESDRYAEKANRIVIKHRLGRTIAVIEIVSPGNKDSRAALRDFVKKTIEFIEAGVHVLIVDPFPPTPRDPQGLHQAIWSELADDQFPLPSDQSRVLVSFEADSERAIYVEPIDVGDAIPDMPLFLAPGKYIHTPLESTYCATWDALPEVVRTAVETGVMPE